MLVSRGWLIHAPLWLLGAGAIWWLAEALHWPQGLANVIKVLACLVLLVVLAVFWHSLVFVTRRGFWLPGERAGRWSDVIDRDGLTLTLRTSTRWGSVCLVDFDRVRGWAWAEQVLSAHLPDELPGLTQSVPHPEHVKRVDTAADRLLQALAAGRVVPAFERRWVGPTADLMMHAVRIDFAPTPAGATIEVLVSDDTEPAQIKVDGTFWAAAEGEYDGSSEELGPKAFELEGFALEGYEHAMFERSVAVLAALLDDAPRLPLPAWQVTTADGQSYDFLPRNVN